MNWPNAITIVRVFLVPVFAVLAYQDTTGARVASLIVFGVASLSDLIDGYLARRFDITTRFGEFWDPTADKLLIGAALVVLVDLRGFPLWAAIVIGFREIAVQFVRGAIVGGGGTLPASPAGKLKTVLQIGMVGWWLLPWDRVGAIHWIWLYAVLAVTLWSGAEYVVRYLRMDKAPVT
ncbi:MAG TPA: CDP-diacylglycerol--glycerol-3-phosphate 3-phosphatidyltransferase [Actinomycetota bacterium]|nr:CDP-diacylglycerol--glycerol-3-phosphate 3-phosphatidyltransferase [Actinomycetota bacterium]